MLPTASERKSDSSTTPWAPDHPGGTTSAIERQPSDVELGIAQPGVETVLPRASRSKTKCLGRYDKRRGLRGPRDDDRRAAECASADSAIPFLVCLQSM